MSKRWIALVAATAGLAVAAGCGGSSGGGGAGGGGGSGGGNANVVEKVGPAETSLNLIAWQGYTEPDVVKPFEASTGCQVHVTYGQTSDEMVQLMRSGNYDGVSASGDATNRLIAAGDVKAVDVQKLIPDWKDISPALQSPPHNTVGGLHYGVSYEWGADVLMYNTKVVTTPPTSWGVIFDGTSFKGKVDAYDSPIYIADAAVYLKATQPDLKITDPYELTQPQFDAAVALLKKQRKQIGNYWGSYTSQISDFKNGSIVIGPTWPYQYNTLKADHVAGGLGAAVRGRDRLGRHVDAVLAGQGPQLHAPVDEVGDDALRAGPHRLHVRVGPGQPEGVHDPGQDVAGLLRAVPRHRPELLQADLLLEDAADRLRRQPRQHLHPVLRVDDGLDRHQELLTPAPGRNAP